MKSISVYHVDAFTTVPFCGNPAGVVPEADGLTETEMQKIARELNLSETAFLFPSNQQTADFRVRYFTPTKEIDFCGHATIGLSWLLATKYGWKDKAKIILATNVGTIPVELTKREGKLITVTMTQATPKVQNVQLDREKIGQIIGVKTEAIDQRYPIKLAYTGNWHLLIPIKSQKEIDNAQPKLDELKQLNLLQQASTTHLFTFHPEKSNYDLYTRDFAPAIGIPEDPVTGSANGALAGYLLLEKICSFPDLQQLKIAQGNNIDRPGTLIVNVLKSQAKEEPIIKVGGTAVITIEGTLSLPE
jgi:trans-2,3-dihydro-3-hydroxyanthranilate isomerase